MTGPVRIQLSRRKGWRMPENTVSVARPGMWGNHAAVREGTPTGQAAVDAFQRWVETEASDAWKGRAKIDLRGKNLACWCRPGAPCHGDVLLKLANTTAGPAGNEDQ